MSDATDKPEPTQPDFFLGLQDETYGEVDREWHQDNLDTVLPMIIILTGLFQFVLRKWILPVSEDIVSKLEDQFPSQGLIYMPEFGAFLMILGFILLLLFNYQKFL